MQGKLGWQEYSVCDGSPYFMMYKVRQQLVPVSTAVGVLGLTGFTSYLGLVDIGQAKGGETVLVSGAAGGVGSNVGWIARNLGCRVVGIAGTSAKCWQLDGDGSATTRRSTIAPTTCPAKIREFCPDGVDVFFDNVGGEILDHALAALNRYGRVVCCGRIAEYLKAPERVLSAAQLGRDRLRSAHHARVLHLRPCRSTFRAPSGRWRSGSPRGACAYLEDVLEGFEQMPRALMRLYDGLNVGKQIVRVKPLGRNRGHSQGRGHSHPEMRVSLYPGECPLFALSSLTSLRICVPSSSPANTRPGSCRNAWL